MKSYTLAALAAILFGSGCQTQEERTIASSNTMMLKATGKVETLPDMATFTIRLDCLKKSVKESKNCLVEKSNELNKKLLSFGIASDDILTTSVDMNKSYTWARNTNIFEGYRSSTVLYITVKDLDKLDEIYTELLENRNLEIGGLSYSHSQIDSLQNEAYLAALKNSDLLADKLVSGFPGKEREILKIGNVEITSSVPGPRVTAPVVADAEMVEQSSARNQSISISKGTVNVHATLYVEYLVK